MFVNRCFDNTEGAAKATPQPMATGMMGSGACVCPPIMECPQERVCHRQMCYEVPHIIPINTKVINHHVYRHTYQPMYTCTMEDEVSNIYDNNCNVMY